MKILICLLVTTILISCNSHKESSQTNFIDKNNCPKDGICTFKVLKNKTLKIKKQHGSTYADITESYKTLLKFEYLKNDIKGIEDDNYKEIIYIEISKNIKELELENLDLIKSKVTFGRLCFCRGQTGYYNIKIGKLSISKINKKTYRLILKFKTDEVPQVITKINETFTLE